MCWARSVGGKGGPPKSFAIASQTEICFVVNVISAALARLGCTMWHEERARRKLPSFLKQGLDRSRNGAEESHSNGRAQP